jgi:hypothetical protein
MIRKLLFGTASLMDNIPGQTKAFEANWREAEIGCNLSFT